MYWPLQVYTYILSHTVMYCAALTCTSINVSAELNLKDVNVSGYTYFTVLVLILIAVPYSTGLNLLCTLTELGFGIKQKCYIFGLCQVIYLVISVPGASILSPSCLKTRGRPNKTKCFFFQPQFLSSLLTRASLFLLGNVCIDSNAQSGLKRVKISFTVNFYWCFKTWI